DASFQFVVIHYIDVRYHSVRLVCVSCLGNPRPSDVVATAGALTAALRGPLFIEAIRRGYTMRFNTNARRRAWLSTAVATALGVAHGLATAQEQVEPE